MKIASCAICLLTLVSCATLTDWWASGGAETIASTAERAQDVLPPPWNMIAQWAAIVFGSFKAGQGGIALKDKMKGSQPGRILG